MEVVGEVVLSVSLELLFSKLASSDLWKYAREQQVHTELKKWEKKLLEIREVVDDAEDKQITKKSVKAWLADLRDLAYDVEDVLDEFGYQVMKRKLAGEPDAASTSKVRKFIPTCCTTFTPNQAMRNVELGSKIEGITRRLEKILAQKDKGELGLEKLRVQIDGARAATQTSIPPPPLVYKPGVYGRDEDKRKILAMLNAESLSSNLSVVSIVAMGGMGKTTLAGLVYDDEETSKHFALKAWVCVSDQFDVETITRAVLRDIAPANNDSQDFHQIQRKLRDETKGKRFLIVLDDLWNEKYDQWDSLRSPLFEGAAGSKILVTTRNLNVATMMGGDKSFYELKHLSEDDCWLVFQKHAFENRNINEHPDLAFIGREIVKKCGGLPLAAKALGGLLRQEQREDKWNIILTSKIWNLPGDKCGILPALRLSYNHLPSQLKRCFVYCAIFPQDYEFKKEELILLWMAEGLIQQSNDDEKMEHLGDDYFCELFSRSFFQLSNNNKSLFVMHDLINELAKSIAGDTCLHLDVELENDFQHPISTSTRHSSFIRGPWDIFKKFERFHNKEHLRTFIALPISQRRCLNYISNKVIEELIPRLGHLRVLSLSSYEIEEIPDSFGKLKHLRYLDLSYNRIKLLPDSIGNLFYLQRLKLSYCERLIRLPISLGNLMNLRHLDVTGTKDLQEMPFQISKLKHLQILSNFIVGKNNSSKIKELKDMSHLEGELCISKLENVVDIQDARAADLKSKPNLKSLIMQWSSELDGLVSGRNQMDVLNSLQPCSNLKKLLIDSYGGPEFPRWIRDALFSKMVDLRLINCRKCTSLPCLGQLPSLKQLRIQGMDAVKKVGAEFYGVPCRSAMKLFPSLESLHFVGMSEWESWEEGSSSIESLFPCLHQLTIENCPKLIEKLPSYLPSLTELITRVCPKLEFPLLRLPSLKELEVYECDEMVLRGGIDLNSLTNLTVYKILGLVKLQQGFVQLLRGLQALNIGRCEELTCLWEDGIESENLHCHQLVSLGCNLRSLTIIVCGKLERLPNGWQSLTCLEELNIQYCPKLVSFPEVGFPPKLRSLNLEDCEGLKRLPDRMMKNSNDISHLCLLEELRIVKCPALICFPKGQLPTTLKNLIISDCENLGSLPEGMMDMCALQLLSIFRCPSLIGFPKGGLPTTLKLLNISCKKLESLPDGIMHHHSTNAAALQTLTIKGCSSLTSFPRGEFPSTLEVLEIEDCEQLESISEEMFHPTNNSLQSLTIRKYPNLKALPDCLYNLTYPYIPCLENLELFPPQIKNLTHLTSFEISHCVNIKTPLSQWGLTRLTSLTRLSIGGMFPDAATFSDDHHSPLLPTTLTSLNIHNFQNLESLTSLSLQTLASLRYLRILQCPKLRSILPRDEPLPDTLSLLLMRGCPQLKQRYSKEEGDDWPKIAHVPFVDIW